MENKNINGISSRIQGIRLFSHMINLMLCELQQVGGIDNKIALMLVTEQLNDCVCAWWLFHNILQQTSAN